MELLREEGGDLIEDVKLVPQYTIILTTGG